MKMRVFNIFLVLCLLLSTGVLAASPDAVTGSAQALDTGMAVTLTLRLPTTEGKIAVSYPAELELLETKTGLDEAVLWDVYQEDTGELSLAWISVKEVPAETAVLTLVFAGEKGTYAFQVTPRELQCNGAEVKAPAFTLTGQIAHQTPCPSAAFRDLNQGAWYHTGVDYVLERELMIGMSATEFCPSVSMSRAMMVTVLYRLAGEPETAGLANPFQDVEDTAWYADAVRWAAANKIVYGVSDTRFAPGNTLTREQMAALFYRYAQFQSYDTTASAALTSFPDDASVSGWARDAMKWAVATELIQGTKDNGKILLAPKDSSTRAQVAVILLRFSEKIEK